MRVGDVDEAERHAAVHSGVVAGGAPKSALTRATGETVGTRAITVGTLAAGGNYTIGSGVNVQAVQRAYSDFLTSALWSSNSNLQRATTYNNLATTLNSSLSSGFSLMPAVTVETDPDGMGNPPTGAANVRLVATNQVAAGNTFDVYIYNGSFALVDNDFQVVVTGR